MVSTIGSTRRTAHAHRSNAPSAASVANRPNFSIVAGGEAMHTDSNASRKRGTATRALIAASVIAMFASSIMLSACAGQFPKPLPPETAAEKRAVMNFNLAECEQLEPHLYRCPASDAPLCTPEFARTDFECVRVTKEGVVIMMPGI
jgi:hypothetical protein